jgi:hypothetical protein
MVEHPTSASCDWSSRRRRKGSRKGSRELWIIIKMMQELGGSQICITGNYLKEECLELFALWKGTGEGRTY